MFPTETLRFDVLGIELPNPFIIEFEPLLRRCLYETEVMSILSRTNMDNYSLELVLKLLTVLLFLLLLHSIVVNIEVMREFPSTIHLLIFKLVVVEADALQMHNKVVGKLAEQTALRDIALLSTGVTFVVCNGLPADELAETTIDVLVALHFQR